MTVAPFSVHHGRIWSTAGYWLSEPDAADLTRIYVAEAESFLHVGENSHAMAVLKRADELLSARIAARDFRAANPIKRSA